MTRKQSLFKEILHPGSNISIEKDYYRKLAEKHNMPYPKSVFQCLTLERKENEFRLQEHRRKRNDERMVNTKIDEIKTMILSEIDIINAQLKNFNERCPINDIDGTSRILTTTVLYSKLDVYTRILAVLEAN